MNPELPNINTLRSEIETAVSKKDLETMQKLLPEYEKLVLKQTRGESIHHIESFSLSEQLERFSAFYDSHNIETPEDFQEQVTEIWNKNAEKIKEAIEKEGFDEILFIPEYNTKDINDKTTSEYNDTYQGANFKKEGSFESVHDTRTGIRIVLLHNDENLDRPELAETKGKSIYDLCNANTEEEKAIIDELIKNKLPLPLEGLTLGESLLADRLHFKETGNHLLDYTKKFGTWTPATYSGKRIAFSDWDPGNSQVHVYASGAGIRNSFLGIRSSRVFN